MRDNSIIFTVRWFKEADENEATKKIRNHLDVNYFLFIYFICFKAMINLSSTVLCICHTTFCIIRTLSVIYLIL